MLFTVSTVLELHAQSEAAAKLKSGRILVAFVFIVVLLERHKKYFLKLQ
jgi:hypothetical protein